MQEWLTDHNIPWDDSMIKPELYKLMVKHKPKAVRYIIDTWAEEYGHTVLRPPPYHCELHSIELLWAQLKRRV